MPTLSPTIVFFSANASGILNFSRAYQRVRTDDPMLVAFGYSADDLTCNDSVQALLERIRQADRLVLLIRFHGGKVSCPCFDEMMTAAAGASIYIDAQNEADLELASVHCPDFGKTEYRDIISYMRYDGEDNWLHLLKRLVHLPAPQPRSQPTEGLYHPRLGVIPDLQTYLSQLEISIEEVRSGTRPVIGVWFFPVRWLDADMAHVNALVTEIERQGGLPVCCFYRRAGGPGLEAKDTRWVRDHYFSYDGCPLIHVLINLMCFSLSLLRPEEAHLMGELNIPILHAMELYASHAAWSTTPQGVSPLDVCVHFAQPEFDGYLLSVPVATRELEKDPVTGALIPRLKPIPERIAKVVRMARNWSALRTKPNREKKIAIIFHNYPPRNDTIGTAIGLDTFKSVHNLLSRLEAEGYILNETYADPLALADQMVSGLTCDRRWLTPDAMAQRAAAQVPAEAHEKWHGQLPDTNKTHMTKDWGPSPGTLFVHQGQLMINGVLNGNIYLGVQPPRGHIEQKDKIHDPNLSPSYHYLFYYRWLRDVFQADAVVHVGTHGSLEWLPGKSAGMSRECYPDLAMGETPNIYPYIINIPSEGTQTKRRSFSCLIDHMIPVMINAGLYESLAELDSKILEYTQIKSLNPTALAVIQRQIWKMIVSSDLHQDLQIDNTVVPEDFDDLVIKIQDYLSELADSAISSGLHVLGCPPEEEGRVELITQIVRIRNGSIPSLREAVSRLWGYDYTALLETRGQTDLTGRYGTHSQTLAAIHEACLKIVRDCIAGEGLAPEWQSREIDQITAFITDSIFPKIMATGNEMEAIIAALEGRFVFPGGSGNPTRGQVDILPTGRNFYSVDPQKMPTSTAWEVGVSMAEKLIDRYRADTGKPLETLGMVLWGSNEFRNYGEDIAQALYLMGVKPVWEPGNGRITGLEIIPASVLKNPRVDITFRISGFFRDGLPNIVELLDEAVMMVAALKESSDINILGRNIRQEKELLIQQGKAPDDAFREAGFRLYGCPPGTYGAGVSDAIYARAWETSDDLGEVFIDWGGYAYGKGVYGEDKRRNFRRRLGRIQAVVKNEDNREHDLFASDDFNSFFGGFIVAAKKESGLQPMALAGDASDPDRVTYRTLAEEVKHIFRSRLLNPKWIESMVEHGFKGAAELSRTVDFAFAWDATSQVIDDWMYQAIAEKYAFDPEMQEWFRRVNPHALQNIFERLMEAVRRKMWQADDHTRQELESLYLEVEGDIEDFTQ
jgi:cobaltochelatase CobN